MTGAIGGMASPLSAGASLMQPQLRGIKTVILDSADTKLGVKLEDMLLGTAATKEYPVVQAVLPNTAASAEGIRPGMVILGQSSSEGLVQRLRRGPYPYAVQFYDLSVDYDTATTPASALEYARYEAESQKIVKEPQLSSRGAGLGVKTTQKVSKSDCPLEARNGDTVTILYEARVASPGGPVYDSTAERKGQPVTFRLGDGTMIQGVEIGIGGMCQGEVREIDIPAALGYGRFGSDVFDVPGDVRLWWKVEVLELVEGEKKFPFR
jgi:FKBP-type peptidyl-prolyl cis-trans isomerase